MKWEYVNNRGGRINLSISYRAHATLYEDGRIDLVTSEKGGHGDPGGDLGPIPYPDLLELLEDARRTAQMMWGEEWGSESPRRAFMRLPLEERRRIMREQAEEAVRQGAYGSNPDARGNSPEKPESSTEQQS